MRKNSFIKDILPALIIPSILIYIAFYFGLLWYISMFFLGIGTLGLLVSLGWMYDCKGQSGCFSGVILVIPALCLPIGLILFLIDYIF